MKVSAADARKNKQRWPMSTLIDSSILSMVQGGSTSSWIATSKAAKVQAIWMSKAQKLSVV